MDMTRLTTLEICCRALISEEEEGRCMLDDEVIGYTQEICSGADLILYLIQEHFNMKRALGDIATYAHKTDRVRQWAEEALLGNYT